MKQEIAAIRHDLQDYSQYSSDYLYRKKLTNLNLIPLPFATIIFSSIYENDFPHFISDETFFFIQKYYNFSLFFTFLLCTSFLRNDSYGNSSSL